MRAIGATALLLALLQDGAVELRWKFAEGRTLRYRMTQTILLERGARKLRQETATTYRMSVERVDPKGNATVRLKYEAFRFDAFLGFLFDHDPLLTTAGPGDIGLVARNDPAGHLPMVGEWKRWVSPRGLIR